MRGRGGGDVLDKVSVAEAADAGFEDVGAGNVTVRRSPPLRRFVIVQSRFGLVAGEAEP